MYVTALAFAVVCFVLVAVVYVRSPSFSIFHPLTFYMAFHGLIFVFRPIVVWWNEYDLIYRGYQFNPSPGDKLTALVAATLGFLSFAFFCLKSGNVPMRFKQDAYLRDEMRRLTPLLTWVLVLCVPLGLYSLRMVYGQTAATGVGYATMVRDAGTGIYVNTSSVGYLVEAQLLLATCGALVAWVFRFRLLALMPLLGFVVYRAGTGGRGPFVTALVTVGLLYLYERRQRFPSLKVVAMLLAVLLVFNSVGSDRGASIRNLIDPNATSTVFLATRDHEQFLEGMDFGNLEFFEYLVYVVPQRSQTYGYFLDNLQIFTEPIPRALWKSKPAGPPFNRIFLMNYGRPVGMTFSLPGEGWYSLGWAGVLLWCGLWGYVLGLIYRRFVTGPQTTFKTAAYMIFIPMLIISFRNGDLISIFRQGLFYFTPVVLWFAIARAMGVPSAAVMRQFAAFKKRRQNAAAEPGGPPRLAPELAGLPPAVQRRRAALAMPPQA